MEEHCKEKFDQIKQNTMAINRVNEVVFNGYGEAIRRTDERVKRIEGKLDRVNQRLSWVLGVGSALVFVMTIAATLIVVLE